MINKLYRSQTDRMLGGVCGGLGQYLGLDATLVRIFFVLLALAGHGIGVLLYILLWVIVPRQGAAPEGATEIAERVQALGNDVRAALQTRDTQGRTVVGAALIVMGLVFFAQSLGIYWLRWLDFDYLWPLLLIGAGVWLLMRRTRGG